jgi:predicted ATPase
MIYSRILLGHPHCVILSFDDGEINEIKYEMADHYQITKYFLQNRENVISDILDIE